MFGSLFGVYLTPEMVETIMVAGVGVVGIIDIFWNG